MKTLTLKSFSQEVEIADHEKVKYFLVFEDGEGDTVRLPVLEETTRELAKHLYSGGPVQKAASVEDELREASEQEIAEEEDHQFEAASVFGDEEVPGDEGYEEDEVPSL